MGILCVPKDAGWSFDLFLSGNNLCSSRSNPIRDCSLMMRL